MKKVFILPLAALLAYTIGFLYLLNVVNAPNISLSPGGSFFFSAFTNITIGGLLTLAILILFITTKKKK